MAYFAPYIDATGLHISTYLDVEEHFVSEARRIYGSDIYLEADSQDYQWIVINAQAHYDTLLGVQASYNNRSPRTAVGTGLDSIVLINGIQRAGETFSTVPVVLVGTAYTAITNGVVADENGNLWNLPPEVILDAVGAASVTATAQESGPVTATIGQVSIIMTPTFGWTSVNNPSFSATPGRGVETDAELRARQKLSVANPSQALTTGVVGGVLAVDGVVYCQLYENDTNAAVDTINEVYNPAEYPEHSITVVVDGGTDADVASAIANRKTPGCYTNGDELVSVIDRFGVPTAIRFFRPTEKSIVVEVTLTARVGYTTAVATAIKQAMADYINGLTAGQNVLLAEVCSAGQQTATNPFSPEFSITLIKLAVGSDTPGFHDLSMDFNFKPVTDVDNISITVS